METADEIDKHIARVEKRGEINQRRKSQGEGPVGKLIATILNATLATERRESPERLQDIKRLQEQQLSMDDSARRTDPDITKNN